MSQALELDALTLAETRALQALEKGKATDEQQALCLSVIIKKICRTHDQSFIPGKADETAFLEGRRFVGNRILRHLRRPVAELHPEEVNHE
tara:strand:+ start:1131 stop:1403 length:273 start_codon:yes stop_codon:yes gene_type:complete